MNKTKYVNFIHDFYPSLKNKQITIFDKQINKLKMIIILYCTMPYCTEVYCTVRTCEIEI